MHHPGRDATQKEVTDIVHGFNIRLDNLTQFMPQERVVAFATMKPPEVLQKTQEAVLNPEVAELHQQLIETQENMATFERVERRKTGEKSASQTFFLTLDSNYRK